MQTDTIFPSKKPVTIISNNKKGTRMLIDDAVPEDKNVIKQEAKKNLKYRDLITEIQRMWNMKAKVIPVITGATRTISKSLTQYLSNILGKHEIKELQKAAVPATANILREVLM
jgi:hypothetical protein